MKRGRMGSQDRGRHRESKSVKEREENQNCWWNRCKRCLFHVLKTEWISWLTKWEWWRMSKVWTGTWRGWIRIDMLWFMQQVAWSEVFRLYWSKKDPSENLWKLHVTSFISSIYNSMHLHVSAHGWDVHELKEDKAKCNVLHNLNIVLLSLRCMQACMRILVCVCVYD